MCKKWKYSNEVQERQMYLSYIPVLCTSTVYSYNLNKCCLSFCCTDSFKKKLSALPSPEREITTVNLKKDVKYGLGKGVYMFS